jgi:hypothetical protein
MVPAKLKPCPFCGAIPRKSRVINITYESGHYRGCFLGGRLDTLSSRVLWPDEFDAWNKRTRVHPVGRGE